MYGALILGREMRLVFGKKKTTSENPEVQAAMNERDKLMADVVGAVKKVDRLQDELLDQYREANGKDH